MTARGVIGNAFICGMIGAAIGSVFTLATTGMIDPFLSFSSTLLFSAWGWRTFREAHID